MIKNDLMNLDKIIFKWLSVGFCDRRNMCCLKKKKFGFLILSKFDDVYLYNFIFFLVIFFKK